MRLREKSYLEPTQSKGRLAGSFAGYWMDGRHVVFLHYCMQDDFWLGMFQTLGLESNASLSPAVLCHRPWEGDGYGLQLH